MILYEVGENSRLLKHCMPMLAHVLNTASEINLVIRFISGSSFILSCIFFYFFNRTIVAYGDDKVSSLVRHVESHSTSIRDEYLLSTGGNNVLKSDYDLSSNNANIAAGGLEHSSNDGSGRSLHTGQVRGFN